MSDLIIGFSRKPLGDAEERADNGVASFARGYVRCPLPSVEKRTPRFKNAKPLRHANVAKRIRIPLVNKKPLRNASVWKRIPRFENGENIDAMWVTNASENKGNSAMLRITSGFP
ncbi:hypothetical protein HPB50_017497 [Hyalomma asiaticum]|uniref:Uncharacterized protein n=1 Tax=Hyalomma asiaticum TaxID=266040 RepID=A0ACB7RQH0_HYAAI|nr:hypothetical protein HPB50_017497 [Hyalomma asiaticum]